MDTCYHEHIVTGSGTSSGADLSLNIPELEFKLGREGMSESSHGKHFMSFGFEKGIEPEKEQNSKIKMFCEMEVTDLLCTQLFYIRYM